MIVAIDPGVTTGWAMSDGRTGVLDLAAEVTEDFGFASWRWHDWFDGMMEEHRPVYVAFERPFFTGRKSPVAEFTSHLVLLGHQIAHSWDVPRREQSAMQVRNWLCPGWRTLKGDKARDALILAAVRLRGFEPATEHAADAVALLVACERMPPRGVA